MHRKPHTYHKIRFVNPRCRVIRYRLEHTHTCVYIGLTLYHTNRSLYLHTHTKHQYYLLKYICFGLTPICASLASTASASSDKIRSVQSGAGLIRYRL